MAFLSLRYLLGGGCHCTNQVRKPGRKHMTDKNDRLTTSAGAPVANNNHALTAGPRGPMLMQDVWFQEKLAHFDREVIPEQ